MLLRRFIGSSWLVLSLGLAIGSLSPSSVPLTLAQDASRLTESVARDVRESADVGEAQLVMALVQKARGNRTEARISVQRAIEALRNALGEKHSLTRAALSLQRSVAT